VFDASLETLVRQFQLRNGLAADGVAGIQTQAMLDSALAASNSPLLSAVTP
jgi:murein L,D-transpeptidase YcbB/YkuD